MGDKTSKTPTITGKLPFIMEIYSVFIRGLVFSLINVPLVKLLIDKKQIVKSIQELLRYFVETYDNWIKTILSDKNILIFLLLCFICGIVLTPLERGISSILIFVRNLVKSTKNLIGKKIFRKSKLVVTSQAKRSLIFSGTVYKREDYIPVMSWLFKNPSAKSHYEWQLFHHYLYWGFTLNFIIFGVLTAIKMSEYITIFDSLLLIILPGIFLYAAMYHSSHMGKVYKFYVGVQKSDNH